MPYKLTHADIHQFHTQGYVVLKRILPASLIADLRRQSAVAREIARRTDPNAQRLSSLFSHPEIDTRPFEDYANLPELLEAVRALVGEDAWMGGLERMSILLEPAERPWATAWHRDFGARQQRVEMEVFRELRVHPRYFHQVNCALYEDSCAWYVPGSHWRDDFPTEELIERNSPWQIGMDQGDLSGEELERYCLDYVERMPGAIRLQLDAGDFCLYRPHGYHLGCYVPYKRRATLHDSVWTPEWKATFERWAAGGSLAPTPKEELDLP
jgi:ectoine hydroxylase-related dioxygenase (phytanoyl-CoA dioxygenase family)